MSGQDGAPAIAETDTISRRLGLVGHVRMLQRLERMKDRWLISGLGNSQQS
jgi:hypothetical protein